MATEDVLAHVPPGADVIVPMANGEPVGLLDALEEHHERLDGVRVHQMHVLHERPYIHAAFAPHLRHVSYFLSHATRAAYHAGACDLVPNHWPMRWPPTSRPRPAGWSSAGRFARSCAGAC